MFLLRRNAGFFHPAFGRDSKRTVQKPLNNRDKELKMEAKKNTGGRPKKENPRSEQLAVMCTIAERKIIEDKAKLLHISMSQYLREIGLTGNVDLKIKSIPPEILALKGTLNQMAANVNQLAKKRNRHDELNAIERAELTTLVTRIKQLVADIKNHLQ